MWTFLQREAGLQFPSLFVLSCSGHSISFSTTCISFSSAFLQAFSLLVFFLLCFSFANLGPKFNLSRDNCVLLFEKISTIHSCRTRSHTSGNFHVKSSKLEIHKNSFSRFGVKPWNEIPCHIRDLPKKEFMKVFHGLFSDILKKKMIMLRSL